MSDGAGSSGIYQRAWGEAGIRFLPFVWKGDKDGISGRTGKNGRYSDQRD